MQFSDRHIALATKGDIIAIKNLLNQSYRGEPSRQGWTTEANIIEGDTRTDDVNLQEIMQKPGNVFLKYTNEEQQIIGCVSLQKQGKKMYLGMFSVSPQLQGGGIGKKILHASEEYARHFQSTLIYMTVISVRTELINWYRRHGYRDTGERKPFLEDGLTGKHLQPLEFMVMEKMLSF